MRTTTCARTAAGITIAVVLLSGCGNDSTPGTPTAAHPVGDGQSGPDSTAVASPLGQTPGTIDPGSYRTTPLPPFGPIGDAFFGRSVEGQRMAEFVTLPSEIDPKLTGGASLSTYVIKDGKSLQPLIGKPVADAAQANGALAGFSTSRATAESTGEKSIVHAVMRFPDAKSATKAADDMHTALISVRDEWGSDLEKPGKIDILPQTRVSTTSGGGTFSSNAFTPHNEYVIYTWAKAPDTEKDWIAQVTAKALELQGPLIDKFPPTPPDQYANLPVDIDGVLRLTVPKQSGDTRYTSDMAVYGPRGAAHTATDPAGALEYFANTGMTNMASDETNVYLTRNADGAKELAADYAKEVEVTNKMVKTDGPAGVPDAACWKKQSTREKSFYCLVQVDKYLGEVSSKDEVVAHQLASAQHLILAASK